VANLYFAAARRLVAVVAAVAAVVAVASCGEHEPSGPVTLPAAYAAVVGSAGLDTFQGLATTGFTPLSPSRARLVGPTYGVAFDAVGTAAVLNGKAYRRVVGGDPDHELTHDPRDVMAGSGREFVLAHVPVDHLPEPELGHGNGPLFWDWKLTVAGQPRTLTSDDTTPGIYTGSVIVINVPVGAEVELGALVNGQAQWIDLRTGKRH
jgi:hypothetical protein